MRRIVALAGLLFAGGGCGLFIYKSAKTMETNESPSPNSAFLYGRFSKTYDEDAKSGFVIRCDDDREYIIEFGPRAPQVIPISPARCALLGAAFMGRRGVVSQNEPFETSMKPVQLTAGTAYYLGDFAYNYSISYNPTTMAYSEQWILSEATDEYQATTGRMRVIYPQLKDIPTEKKLLSETIMSPEEIARMVRACSEQSNVCRASCNDSTDRDTCLRDCGIKKRDCAKKLPRIGQ